MTVRRVGGEAWIFERSTNSEMVKTLILVVFQSQDCMNFIVKKTADAGTANTVRLGRQV